MKSQYVPGTEDDVAYSKWDPSNSVVKKTKNSHISRKAYGCSSKLVFEKFESPESFAFISTKHSHSPRYPRNEQSATILKGYTRDHLDLERTGFWEVLLAQRVDTDHHLHPQD